MMMSLVLAAVLTPWGEKVTAENAWREYPRPEMVRTNWQSLNGNWSFGVGKWQADELPRCDRTIIVPFPVESPLSGVGRLVEPDEVMVYERTFAAEPKAGERTILHFESVDYRAQVFVNGREATDVPHEGCSLPFELDVTRFLVKGDNRLRVVAWDPTNAGDQAVGKQFLVPQQCFYTRASGIMGSVWLEQVPAKYVRGYRAVADVDASTVRIEFDLAGSGEVEVRVRGAEGTALATPRSEDAAGAVTEIKIPKAKLWSPEEPHLYAFTAKFGEDAVTGYFAFRKLERRKDAKGHESFFLNGKKTYLLATLDQGWWPDGLLTPPSEEAMRYDLEILRKAGFNAVRKHIKVEPRRFYYDCDRLGMMVVQDLPCGYALPKYGPWVVPGDIYRLRRHAEVRRELKGMVDHLRNHPSIVMWSPFNECWGQPNRSFSAMTLVWLKDYDTTRFVNGPSGWWDWWTGGAYGPGQPQSAQPKVAGDVPPCDTYDRHDYSSVPTMKVFDNAGRIAFLGEYGGLSLAVEGHLWPSTNTFGYATLPSREALLEKYARQADCVARLAADGVGGSVYTQTTDVEIEYNGLMTYDRRVIKYDLKELRRINRRILDAACASSSPLERTLDVPGVGAAVLKCAEPGPWQFRTSVSRAADDTHEILVRATAPAPAPPPRFSVGFAVPQRGHDHFWAANSDTCGLPADWGCWRSSELSCGMPLYCYFDGEDRARLTVAASDAARFVEFRGGLIEEGCRVKAEFEFMTQKEAPIAEYAVRLRIDDRVRPFAEAVRAGADWIFAAIGGKDDPVPDAAFAPLYSSWYQFHQNVFDREIEAECALAAKDGMKVVIVDDGWQTDDNHRGYSFCGDWEVSTNRFPNMRDHVARVHRLGMKYMMWFSVPFVGKNSRFAYERFKGMLLDDHGDGTCVLDPRYPEVRDYLAGVYERAVREWDIDGVKLDFIDQMTSRTLGRDPKLLEAGTGRDTLSMSEAVDRLLADVTRRLRAIKPDILVEFRQSYIGPVVRKYGNMLRAADCPGDRAANRIRIANLRLTSGAKAVHADMLEWNGTDTVEHAALAVLNALFGVVQYSVMLRELPDSHREMIRAWIAFSQTHREALLKGVFRPHFPQLGYPLIEGESAAERIVGVYQPGQVAPSGAADRKVIYLNATGTDGLVVDLAAKPAKATAYDTFGKAVPTELRLAAGLNRVSVPLAGRLEIEF